MKTDGNGSKYDFSFKKDFIPLCCQCQMGAVDVTIRIACGISQIQLMISTEINIIMDPRFIYAWKEFKVEKEKKEKGINCNRKETFSLF